MTARSIRWVYLTTAPNQLVAELWCQLLSAAGIPARIDPADMPLFPALGLGTTGVRLQVPASQVDAARLVLAGLEFSSGDSSPETPQSPGDAEAASEDSQADAPGSSGFRPEGPCRGSPHSLE